MRNARTLSTLLLACLLLSGCGGGGGGQATPSAPAVPPPPLSPLLSTLSRAGTLTIMPLGDSITYGSGDPDVNGYRLPLWNALTASGAVPRYVGSQQNGSSALPDRHHEGHPGYTIDQIAGGVDGWLQITQPEIILLMIGTNDIPGDQIATAPDRLSALIDQIVKDDPQAHLLVASIPPFTRTDRNYTPLVDTYNAAIPGIVRAEAAAGKSVTFVDIHDTLTGSDLVDGVHPNPGGYAKMGAAWFQALQQLGP